MEYNTHAHTLKQAYIPPPTTSMYILKDYIRKFVKVLLFIK